MNKPEVQILLSTFNGEKYLPELLASLNNQDYMQWSLLARDDGSTDRTQKILDDFSRVRDALILRGDNIGPTSSFLALIQNSAPDVDFLALCDQDDIWKPHKLSRAVEKLNRLPQTVPAMYCSRLELVNCDLEPMGLSTLVRKRPAFENALVENLATGSTMLLNRAARDLLLDKMPASAIMHDWWIYLTVSSLGSVIYDPCPSISYRLHDSNVVGQHKGAALLFKRMQRFISKTAKSPIVDQAEEFRDIYGHLLSQEKRRILHLFVHGRKSAWTRLQACSRANFYRQNSRDTLAAKCLYVLNRL